MKTMSIKFSKKRTHVKLEKGWDNVSNDKADKMINEIDKLLWKIFFPEEKINTK